MAVSLSDNAAARVRTYLDKRGGGVGLRLGVRKSGCNGWAYVIDYADAVEANDAVFEQDGLKVLVDRESLPMLDGTQVDFVK
ncbi:MAG: iron-sulfur cluster assembly accessory protein, partial [Pseudomonadota bacterium]